MNEWIGKGRTTADIELRQTPNGKSTARFTLACDGYKDKECDIKLMLSSSAEWDISKITNFIRYNEDEYVRSITLLFSRVGQSKFLKYNKVFKKSGIAAYRLSDSPDWTEPVKDNLSVYTHIIENYKL